MKANFFLYICCLLSYFSCGNTEDGSTASEILSILDDVYFETGTEEDKVLVLGVTGVGKSFVSCLLIGDETLEAIEGDLYQIVIIDQNGRVSTGPITQSRTVAPDRMTDGEYTYFDCPGFDDTRGTANDISVSYFIRRLIDHANTLKFVFVTNYAAFTSDRNSFPNLAAHATAMIKNITNYEDGIMLIVNKTPNERRNGELLADEVYYQRIINELNKIKNQKIDENNASNNAATIEQNKNTIEFIDVILKADGTTGSDKIGIVREVEDIGFINDMEIYQTQRQFLQQIINKNLKFIPKIDEDFEHTISDRSKIILYQQFDLVLANLQSSLDDIAGQFNNFIIKMEQDNSDLAVVRDNLSSLYKKMRIFQFTSGPRSFVQLIRTDLLSYGELNIPEIMSTDLMSDEYFNILETLLIDRDFSPFFQINEYLVRASDFLVTSTNWYEFLITLDSILLSSADQINAQELIEETKIGENEVRFVKAIKLYEFLESINESHLYRQFENAVVNFFELKALRNVLESHLIDNFDVSCLFNEQTKSNDMTVTGYKLKISNIVKHSCWEKARYIEIFAINKLFIDEDLNEHGKVAQISIIAPLWSVSSEHIFDLTGVNGVKVAGKPCKFFFNYSRYELFN